MPNERTLYELPGDEGRLMMLLRTGGVRCYCTKTPCPGTSTCPGDGYAGTHMLASTCVLKHSPSQPIRAAHAVPATPEPQHVCRPGTGLWNTGLPGDRMPTVGEIKAPYKNDSLLSSHVAVSNGIIWLIKRWVVVDGAQPSDVCHLYRIILLLAR